MAEELGVKLLGQIPLVQSVREAADSGDPIATRDDAIMGIAFHNLADNLVAAVEARNSEFPPTSKVEITHR